MKENGSLVKRLRRRPLTAESGVRFPYELLTILKRIAQPERSAVDITFTVLFLLFYLQFRQQLGAVNHSLLVCEINELAAAAVMAVHQLFHHIMIFFR